MTIRGSVFGILIKTLTAEILPDSRELRPLKEVISVQNGNGSYSGRQQDRKGSACKWRLPA
jgi:hypothetical protein